MLIETMRQADVAILRFNRPNAMNASSMAMKRELLSALTLLENDTDVRVVVLTGSGCAFCAGGDLKEKPKLSRQDVALSLSIHQEICSRLHASRPVTIAAVNGHALGGGLEMAANCDIRIAAASARFGAPVGNNASLSTGGLHYTLQRIIGAGRARDLILTGRSIDAETAVQYGLATMLSSDADLMNDVLEMAESLSAQSPDSIRLGKQMLLKSEFGSYDAVAKAELEACLSL